MNAPSQKQMISDLQETVEGLMVSMRELRTELLALKPKQGRAEVSEMGPDDVPLYEALVEWRLAESRRLEIPAYRVFTNRQLASIAMLRPEDRWTLSEIKGVGPERVESYGAAVLGIVGSVSW